MPSFLNDENSPIHSQQLGVIHLDPATQFGLCQEKVNGQFPRQPPPSQPSNESFEDSSTHSTHLSDDSDARAQLTGDDSWPSMSTLQTTSNGGSTGVSQSDGPDWMPLPNGNSTTLVDRTRHPKPFLPNGNGKSIREIRDGDTPTASPWHVPVRTSTHSTVAGSGPHSPVEPYAGYRTSEPALSPPLSTGPVKAAASLASLTPATPTAESSRNPHSPHRFSSPPAYNPAGATLAVAGPNLKHRHTLEVPKAAQSRSSRDGLDSAATSGRFSPTNPAGGGRRASLSLVRRNTRSIHSDHPRDEVTLDEDALRWAEAYRAKRANKRKRRELEDDDHVLVGTKVDESHANWVTAYNMLTGIRVSVSRTNAKLDRPLTSADFEAKQKSTFDM